MSVQEHVDQHAPATQASASSIRPLRMTILFSLLVLMLLALGYDYAIARPGRDAAHEAITEFNSKMMLDGSGKATLSEDIQKLLGKKPSRTYVDGPYTVEVYSWLAGMPIGIRSADDQRGMVGLRSHDLFALYYGSGPKAKFVKHFSSEIPDGETNVNPLKDETPVAEDDESDAANSGMDFGRSLEGGGGGGGEGRRGRRGRGGEGGEGRGGPGGGRGGEGRPQRPPAEGEQGAPPAEGGDQQKQDDPPLSDAPLA